MRTLAVGSEPAGSQGFTLLELLVVLALIGVATAGVGWSLRDSAHSALERDADRLASLFETARAQSRANGAPVVWRTTAQGDAQGFAFEGLRPPGLPRVWLSETTRAASDAVITLGPEPLIEPQSVALSSSRQPGRRVWVVSNGLQPFRVQNSPEWGSP